MDPPSLIKSASSSLKEEEEENRATTTTAPDVHDTNSAATMNHHGDDDSSSMDNDGKYLKQHTKGHASTKATDENADDDDSTSPMEVSDEVCKKQETYCSPDEVAPPTTAAQDHHNMQQQDDNNNHNDALSVMMTTARQNAAAIARSNKRLKTAADKNNNNAFEEMMYHAKMNPSAFDAHPPTQLLLEHCQKAANLVVVTMNDKDDDNNSDDDDSLILSLLQEDDENTNVSKAVKEIQEIKEEHGEECLKKRYCAKRTLDQVVFASSASSSAKEEEEKVAGVVVDDTMTTITTNDQQQQQQQQQEEPEEGVYVRSVLGYIDTRLKHRRVIIGLTFFYSNRTQITYCAPGEQDMIDKQRRGGRSAINYSLKKEEFSLDEGEHLVSMETMHYCLPRMLQRVVFHTSTGRTIAIGLTEYTPAVAVHRHLKIDKKDHVISGLDWYAEESMVLSLKTQSLDAIRQYSSRNKDYDAPTLDARPPSASSSLVRWAHEAEYNRLHDQARDLETKAMSHSSRHWTHVRHRVGQVGEKYQELLRETDEAKALKEIKVVQDMLEERFRKKAKLLKTNAQKEMDAVVKQGNDKQEKIKNDYVSNGSSCLQEHQAVVNHLSLIGMDHYASMTVPTVCSALKCRRTFDLAKRPATERCSFPNCCTITQAPYCGSHVNQCSVCSEPYCILHYNDHHKWCKYKVDQKCGYHKESGKLTSRGCHKRSRNPAAAAAAAAAALRTCCTCGVQCCKDCSSVCAGACADRMYLDLSTDEYSRRYALCKQCQFVVGDATVCHGCYQRMGNEWNDSDSDSD